MTERRAGGTVTAPRTTSDSVSQETCCHAAEPGYPASKGAHCGRVSPRHPRPLEGTCSGHGHLAWGPVVDPILHAGFGTSSHRSVWGQFSPREGCSCAPSARTPLAHHDRAALVSGTWLLQGPASARSWLLGAAAMGSRWATPATDFERGSCAARAWMPSSLSSPPCEPARRRQMGVWHAWWATREVRNAETW